MYLKIDGHTDYVGNDEYNHTLSHNRAAAVKDYFISKGIAENRLTSAGHGETMPIADNKTLYLLLEKDFVVMDEQYRVKSS